ncbi:MAG: hypothetical protein AB7G47_16400 [Mycolicibacterium sp.]
MNSIPADANIEGTELPTWEYGWAPAVVLEVPEGLFVEGRD